MTGNDTTTRKRALAALLLLVPYPSFGTWMAMVVAEGTAGQIVFGAMKVYLWLFPLLWLVLVDGKRPSFPRPAARGMAAACITGSIMFVAIGVAYWLLGGHWIDVEFMQDKIAEVGLGTPLRYLLGALYWCTINSMLEEYVWRWFVVTRCEVLMPRRAAIIASGAFFTLHHIIALEVYFDWRVSILGSVGIFIGGTTWSWLYLRYRNIWAAYVSHVFADVIIFAIGWQIVFM